MKGKVANTNAGSFGTLVSAKGASKGISNKNSVAALIHSPTTKK